MTSHTDNSARPITPADVEAHAAEVKAQAVNRINDVLIDVLKIEGLIAAAVEILPNWEQAAQAAKFKRWAYDDA